VRIYELSPSSRVVEKVETSRGFLANGETFRRDVGINLVQLNMLLVALNLLSCPGFSAIRDRGYLFDRDDLFQCEFGLMVIA
jgi:hypothetical protein